MNKEPKENIILEQCEELMNDYEVVDNVDAVRDAIRHQNEAHARRITPQLNREKP